MRASPAIVCLVAVVGASAPAIAQPRDPVAADALFREGRAAMKAGDLPIACEKLKESQRLDPAPGTLLNLSECEEKRGRLAVAWEHARRALDTMAQSDERIAMASARVAALERRLPRLTIRLASSAAGARVVRDEVELGVGSFNTALPVDPGPHAIIVSLAGREDRRYEVTVGEGQRSELTVDVGPASTTDAGATSSEVDTHHRDARGSSSKTLGWIGVGVGGAFVVAGSVFGVLAIDRRNTHDRHCKAGVCDQVGFDAGNEGRTFAVASTLGIAVGAALVVGGVVWLFTHAESR